MIRLNAVLAVFLFSTPAFADLKPVVLEPVSFQAASVALSSGQGNARYTQSELEKLDTFTLLTTTPWRTEATLFSGVRLRDLLKRNGLYDAQTLMVTAENGYQVVLERDVWTKHDPLVATRVNGAGHTRRERGPIQLVFDMDADPETGSSRFQKNWVWMLSQIDIGPTP